MMAIIFLTLALVLAQSARAVHWHQLGAFGHEGKIADKASNFVSISEATAVGMVVASFHPFGESSTNSEKKIRYNKNLLYLQGENILYFHI